MFKQQLAVNQVVILIFLTQYTILINAGNDWVFKNDVETTPKQEEINCINPNRQMGTCISIYDCKTLIQVLKLRLERNFSFVSASQCPHGTGRAPYVCCTKETQFKPKSKPANRIIYPDELEKLKERHTVGDESTTVKESSTVIATSEATTVSKPTTTTAANEVTTASTTTTKLTPAPEASSVNTGVSKFPKPPKCGGITLATKIFGGQDADLNEFSWMVILEYRNLKTGELTMDCAGSIINERYVLTAAHCVTGEIEKVNGKLESVRVGEHNTATDVDCNGSDCRPPFARIRIESVTAHKEFSAKTSYGTRNQHDIALIRLNQALKLGSNLQPICLPDTLEEYPENTNFMVAGWGHNGTARRTATKQKLILPLVKHSDCRSIFSSRFYLADEQLCAGGRFREDSCGGDSGGPLMRITTVWMLEGIVSFGLGCGLERPGIYTNVRHYLNWIDENVRM